jgi:hypothetical protein
MIRTAVIYDDGTWAGNPEVLRQILHSRAAVRSAIPCAERAFQDLAARAMALPDLIRDMDGWRKGLMRGCFTKLVAESAIAPTAVHPLGLTMLHERVLTTLKASSRDDGKPSLSQVIDRVMQMLKETESALSMSPIEI